MEIDTDDKDFMLVNIPARSHNCCPVSLIMGMLASGLLNGNNREIADIIAKFFNDPSIYDELKVYVTPDQIKKVTIFINNYGNEKTLEEKKKFFDNIEKTAQEDALQCLATGLRLASKNYMSSRLDTPPHFLRQQYEESIEDNEFTPGYFSTVDTYSAYLTSLGFKINLYSPRPELNKLGKSDDKDVDEVLSEYKLEGVKTIATLNVKHVNENHFEARIDKKAYKDKIKNGSNPATVKRSSVPAPSVSATLSLVDPAKPSNKLSSKKERPQKQVSFKSLNTDKEDDDHDHDEPDITPPAKDKNAFTLIKQVDFKKYLLNDYKAKAESGKEYSVKGADNDVNIYLENEKVAIVAEDLKHKNNIKLDITPDKEKEGAFVALSSFKGFLEANGHELQKYNAHFTGYDTSEKAQGFLESLYNVFNENDVFNCDLVITFDRPSQKAITEFLENRISDDSQEAGEKNKWIALYDRFVSINGIKLPTEDEEFVLPDEYDTEVNENKEDDEVSLSSVSTVSEDLGYPEDENSSFLGTPEPEQNNSGGLFARFTNMFRSRLSKISVEDTDDQHKPPKPQKKR